LLRSYAVVTSYRGIGVNKRLSRVTNSPDMLAAQMEPARQTFEPAGAGALLVTGTAAGIGCGALIGWAAGSVGYGLLAGAAVGVPLGVYAVYRRYGKSL
jgi:F0F1-type ATP synthase assembly protein I